MERGLLPSHGRRFIFCGLFSLSKRVRTSYALGQWPTTCTEACCTHRTARPALGPRTDGEKDAESLKKKTLVLAARIFFLPADGANRSLRQLSRFWIRARAASWCEGTKMKKSFWRQIARLRLPKLDHRSRWHSLRPLKCRDFSKK